MLWEAINRSDRQTSQSVMRRAWRGRAAVCSGAACAAYDECLLLVTRSEMPDKRDKRDNKSVRATFNFGSSCQWRGNERWPQKKRLRQRFKTSYSRKLADLIVPPFRRTSLFPSFHKRQEFRVSLRQIDKGSFRPRFTVSPTCNVTVRMNSWLDCPPSSDRMFIYTFVHSS